MDKIKAFFENKIVKVVSQIVLAVVSVVLILGGVSTVEIGEGVELVGGIVTAVAALVIFISGKIRKQSSDFYIFHLSWGSYFLTSPFFYAIIIMVIVTHTVASWK